MIEPRQDVMRGERTRLSTASPQGAQGKGFRLTGFIFHLPGWIRKKKKISALFYVLSEILSDDTLTISWLFTKRTFRIAGWDSKDSLKHILWIHFNTAHLSRRRRGAAGLRVGARDEERGEVAMRIFDAAHCAVAALCRPSKSPSCRPASRHPAAARLRGKRCLAEFPWGVDAP
ncbi:hypothetical protein K1W69_19455 [Hoeflea sp. WL0058]|uniref:Uncharacterized protein n=1 Tax=Flavimaribacter sediminis TaxID=2865987 RepID=A0AAE3D181_9HYPH|nr:hypothetical protein [Flavimaribacter sediminis]MBW8639380.1 hypothetical protein [Flavimaribacter sediminis]